MFIRRGDRLATRIRALLFGWRFARQVGGFTIFNWLPRDKPVYGVLPVQDYSPALIWDLATFYSRRPDMFFMESYNKDVLFPSLSDPEYAPFRPDNFERAHFQGKAVTFLEERSIPKYRFAGERMDDVIEQIRSLYAELPMQPRVRDFYETARAKIVGDYTAVHVRRGDIIGVLRARRDLMESGELTDELRSFISHCVTRTAPYGFYYPHIEAALARGEKVLLFSDTAESISHFVDRYGSRNITDGSRFSRKLPEEMQRAFLEFNLLISAKHLIGTSSVYFNMAIMLGGGRRSYVNEGASLQEYMDYVFDDVLDGFAMSPRGRDAVCEAIASALGARYRKAA